MCNTILRCDNLTFTLTCIPKPRSKHETPSFASFVLYVRVCTVLAHAQASQTTHLLTKPSISHPHESYAGCKASMSYRQNIRSTTPPVIRKHPLPKYPTATLQAGSNAPSLATPPNPQRKTQKPHQTHTATPKPTSPPIHPVRTASAFTDPYAYTIRAEPPVARLNPHPVFAASFSYPPVTKNPLQPNPCSTTSASPPPTSRKAEKPKSWQVGLLECWQVAKSAHATKAGKHPATRNAVKPPIRARLLAPGGGASSAYIALTSRFWVAGTWSPTLFRRGFARGF